MSALVLGLAALLGATPTAPAARPAAQSAPAAPAASTGTTRTADLTSAAEPAASAASASDALAAPPRFRERLDLSHLFTVDSLTARHLSFSDLRLGAEAQRLFDVPLGVVIDGRARHSWNALADDRTTLTEGYLRYGDDTDAWRLRLGRQLIRAVASAEVDGASLEHQWSPATSAVAFAGLLPNPWDMSFNPDFITAGVGLENKNVNDSQSGGLVLCTYRQALDRAYATHRALYTYGQTLTASSFTTVDFLSREPLAALGSKTGLDLTSFNGLVRLRPARAFDTSLAVTHNHTLLPNRWWDYYISEEQKRHGFVIDGLEPVGTRLSSVRWTNTLSLGPAFAPYVRLRYDMRHNQKATGSEARAGLKWRPAFGYVNVAVAYRDYFGVPSRLGEATFGIEQPHFGVEGGLTVLALQVRNQAGWKTSYNPYGMTWFDLGAWSPTLAHLRLLGEYQGFLEPTETTHAFFVQLAHRL